MKNCSSNKKSLSVAAAAEDDCYGLSITLSFIITKFFIITTSHYYGCFLKLVTAKPPAVIGTVPTVVAAIAATVIT